MKIRSMLESDISAFVDSFAEQGWRWRGKSEKLFTKYYDEQMSGKRQVVVAEESGEPAGYVTLLPSAAAGPFAGVGIPEIVDFNVLIKFRGRGIGWAIMNEVERLAKQMSNAICLGVGLYADYGTAQRMYVKRGYIPDGSGVWFRDRHLMPGDPCINDDDLILYLSKEI